MNGELDGNKIAAEFITQNMGGFMEVAKAVLKGTADKIRLRLGRTYTTYLSSLWEKYSKAKSFLLRGESSPLYHFYVHLDLQMQNRTISDVRIKDILNIGKSTIITGPAGCGKSMLIKHLILDSLLTKARVPIFVELRQFNTFDGDLFELMLRTVKSLKFSLGPDYLRKAIESGHFVIFLDGYDEVAHQHRQRVKGYILEFVQTSDRNDVVVTSRPDQELEGWQAFSVLKVCPLSLPKACSVVEKLPFDEKLKARFLADLRTKLFETHESFLSNPLLLSIMLLTYGLSASIPNKLSIFYNQAYEALFVRHDVLKNGFKRQFLTTLDILDFAKLFSAFCLQAYDNNKLEFTHTEALDYIEFGQDVVGIACKKEDYLKDLIQAVSLMVQDGLQIVYAHRSFQEYFTARFICEARPDVQKRLISKYDNFARMDDVFDMLYEMRPDIVERYYIVPGLDRLFNIMKCKRSVGVTHHERFIRALCRSISIHNGRIVMAPKEKGGLFLFDLVSFTLQKCSHLININWKVFRKQDEEKYKSLEQKWCVGIESPMIDVSTQPEGRQFLRELAKLGGFMSIEMLQVLLRIRVALKEKAKLEEQTLRSILKKK